MKQDNLPNKTDIANFVKTLNFIENLISFDKRINSNKSKNVLVENELNELSKKNEAISTKGLTKILINGYNILAIMWDKIFLFRNIAKSFNFFFQLKIF